MDLNGKVAIVTGAGRGIGRAIAEKMAEYGARVVVADLAVDTVVRVAEDLTRDGHEAEAIAVDVTRASSVDRMVRGTVARFGQVDILVNNAGVIAAPGWEDRNKPNDRDWDMIYSVNVKGVSKTTDAAVRQMRRRSYGKIINIASGAGRQGSPDNPPYNVSKAGVISLTQAYALELAADNINVNAICPGLLWTPMWERIAKRRIRIEQPKTRISPRRAFEQTVKERIPLGREQTPEDIGNLAVFLASDLAENITGQAINVNGGSRMD